MLSVLTIERVGVNTVLANQQNTIEMFHSLPDGLDTMPLVSVFLHEKPSWSMEFGDEEGNIAVLRDSYGLLWVAQSQIYDNVCFVES